MWISYEKKEVWTTDKTYPAIKGMDVKHTDVLCNSSIKELSLEKALERLWDLQEEILMFLGMKDKNVPTTERQKLENWPSIPDWQILKGKYLFMQGLYKYAI